MVEDRCDVLGSTFEGRLVGTFGDISTLSFYPAHHITMGEGGAVFTQNMELKRIAESYWDWGWDRWCAPSCDNTCRNRFCWQLGELPAGDDHKYTYSHVGQPQDQGHAGFLRAGLVGAPARLHRD